MIGLWTRLGEVVTECGRAALVTVVEVRGSTPREAGARMIVTADSGYSGTIGGGMLEYEAIALAARRLREGANGAHLRRVALGPELGQCCGGRATLMIEAFSHDRLGEIERLAASEAAGGLTTEARFQEGRPLQRSPIRARSAMPAVALDAEGALVESFVDPRHPVTLFGAGHVGRALILALAPLPFRVSWIDSREAAFPGAVPPNTTAHCIEDPVSAAATARPGAFILVMTHSHPLDLEICRAALARSDLFYVGLIGSATKRARFVSRLVGGGLSPEAVARLVCPIGLPGLVGKAPSEIAASVAADLLLRRQRIEADRPEAATGQIEAVADPALP